MLKSEIVEFIIDFIESDLEQIAKAALESAELATDDQSKSEGKYDTRGLETSYLASAQAHYVQELKEQLEEYRNLQIEDFSSDHPIALGALVSVIGPVGRERYFCGPAQGGLEIPSSDGAILVVTFKSPLGATLLGKKVGGKVGTENNLTVIKVE